MADTLNALAGAMKLTQEALAKPRLPDVKHFLEEPGWTYCGAKAEAETLTDRIKSVTCPACIQSMKQSGDFLREEF